MPILLVEEHAEELGLDLRSVEPVAEVLEDRCGVLSERRWRASELRPIAVDDERRPHLRERVDAV